MFLFFKKVLYLRFKLYNYEKNYFNRPGWHHDFRFHSM